MMKDKNNNMKKLIPILTVFLSFFLFPSTSLGEWTYVTKNIDGSKYFVDFDRIRERKGYVYYWTLGDLSKPTGQWFSVRTYNKGDCEQFRDKVITVTVFKGQMGEGESLTDNDEREWKYPPPDSSMEVVLKTVCNSI